MTTPPSRSRPRGRVFRVLRLLAIVLLVLLLLPYLTDRLGVADRGIREGILRSLIAAGGEGDRMRSEVLRLRREQS